MYTPGPDVPTRSLAPSPITAPAPHSAATASHPPAALLLSPATTAAVALRLSRPPPAPPPARCRSRTAVPSPALLPSGPASTSARSLATSPSPPLAAHLDLHSPIPAR